MCLCVCVCVCVCILDFGDFGITTIMHGRYFPLSVNRGSSLENYASIILSIIGIHFLVRIMLA